MPRSTASELAALPTALELVSDRARIKTIGAFGSEEANGLTPIEGERSAERLAGMIKLWEKGDLEIFLRDVYSLDQAAEAHAQVETGHGRGKSVLLPNRQSDDHGGARTPSAQRDFPPGHARMRAANPSTRCAARLRSCSRERADHRVVLLHDQRDVSRAGLRRLRRYPDHRDRETSGAATFRCG